MVHCSPKDSFRGMPSGHCASRSRMSAPNCSGSSSSSSSATDVFVCLLSLRSAALTWWRQRSCALMRGCGRAWRVGSKLRVRGRQTVAWIHLELRVTLCNVAKWRHMADSEAGRGWPSTGKLYPLQHAVPHAEPAAQVNQLGHVAVPGAVDEHIDAPLRGPRGRERAVSRASAAGPHAGGSGHAS